MTSPRKEKREETFFAKENARLRKLEKEKAKNKSSWFSQPRQFPKEGKKLGVSESLADMLGRTPGKRVAGLAARAGIAGAPLGGAANVAKVGIHALSVRARLARLKAAAKRKNGKAKGGLIKSSRKKSKIDGIARRGKTRGKHR